jgi:hypothetical protein
VALSPYAGLYADYYFSKDDAQTAGLTTVPLLQGFSARATGGVAAIALRSLQSSIRTSLRASAKQSMIRRVG